MKMGLMLVTGEYLIQCMGLPKGSKLIRMQDDIDHHGMFKIVVESQWLPEAQEGELIPTVIPAIRSVDGKLEFISWHISGAPRK